MSKVQEFQDRVAQALLKTAETSGSHAITASITVSAPDRSHAAAEVHELLAYAMEVGNDKGIFTHFDVPPTDLAMVPAPSLQATQVALSQAMEQAHSVEVHRDALLKANMELAEALNDSVGAIGAMRDQIDQMKGMFPDDDGTIAEALKAGEDAVSKATQVLESAATASPRKAFRPR
ncbi:hypothetical protein [Cupriavidus sp. L7L]|uniref:hypothetical protein n=1 Tax=Cupriavidus sp. L7L TaxID=2546443 RepID=UPI00105638C2|nr:hypothetical protein [Cupriavidus sp. L7L]TDF54500.1 hypothetical protein E1J61_36655 [Cupriavidus sp. L7L]